MSARPGGQKDTPQVDTMNRPTASRWPDRSVERGATRPPSAGLLPSLLLGLALTAYTVAMLTREASAAVVVLPVVLVLVIAMTLIALNDLETFVLVALAIRSSLDVFKGGARASSPGALLGLLLLGLGGLWLVNRRVKLGAAFPASRLGLAFAAFGVVAFLGVLTSPSPGTALDEWSRIASIAVVFLVVEQFAARGAGLGRFVAALGLSVLVPSAFALWQLTSGSGLRIAGGFHRITGTFVHSNPLAYFAVFTWFLMLAAYPVLRGTRRHAVAVVLVLTTGLILFSFTRSAWLVAVLGLLVLTFRHRSYVAVAAGCALLVLVAVSPPVQNRFADLETASQVSGKPANSLSWRVDYWKQALEIAEPSPIAGVGLRTVATTTTAAKQPHNDLVRAYVEVGIPGLVSYLVLLTLMVWCSLTAAVDASRRRLGGLERAVTEAALVTALGVALLSLVANLMSQVVVMMYAVTILALSSGAYLRRRRLDAEVVEG